MYDPRSLIGLHLKSDDIIEYLRHYGLTIIYEIDLDHENMKDIYWVADKEGGCQWEANENQMIVTVFVYLREIEGFKKHKWPINGVQIEKHQISNLGEPTKRGSYQGENWVRYDLPDISIHYSWDDHGSKKVTLMHPSRVPK
jgi:hypothetical protein